jgi:hypothetical protein
MRPVSVVDDSQSTVTAVNEESRNSMSYMSAWRAKGYRALPYLGSSTVQLVTSLISIIIGSNVLCKSRTLPHTILSGGYVFDFRLFALLPGQ